jgi:integrase
VLRAAEALRIIETMKPSSMHRLMTELLYGSGLRAMECCTLRLRDLDFERGQIAVRGGKGDKDRVVMMPRALRERLGEQCRRVHVQHRRDVLRDGG